MKRKILLKKICLSLSMIMITCCLCLTSVNCYAQEQKDGQGGVNVTYVKEKSDTYFLYVTIIGNGSLYDGESILRDQVNKYELEPGIQKTFTFAPDKGYRLERVLLNNIDITSRVISGSIVITSEDFNQQLKVYYHKEESPFPNEETHQVVKTNDETTILGLILIALISFGIGLYILIRKKED